MTECSPGRTRPVSYAGHALASVGLIAAFAVLVGDSDPAGDALNFVFLALMLPGMLVSVIGSTVLGIALLRSDYAPKVTAWLLALALPLMLAASEVLGHNSLGMLPIFLAWAASGRNLWRGELVLAPPTRRAPAGCCCTIWTDLRFAAPG